MRKIIIIFLLMIFLYNFIYPQTPNIAICNRYYKIGKVSPMISAIYNTYEKNRKNRQIFTLLKVWKFIYYYAIESGFGDIIREKSIRCIKIDNFKYKGGILTPSKKNLSLIDEFYDEYLNNEKDFLNNLLKETNLEMLIFWEPIEEEDLFDLTTDINVALLIYDLTNNVLYNEDIQINLKKYRLNRKEVKREIVEHIKEIVNKIYFTLTQGEEE